MTQTEIPRPDAAPRRAPATDDAGAARALLAGSAVVFAAIAALVGADVVGDRRAGGGGAHVAIELAVMALALAATVAIWAQLLAARRRAGTLASDLGAARAEAARWRAEAQEALRGLGAAIDAQFERWGLSAAEREVGLLLLKGLSHKEVADARGTSERTVRQQALAVYAKAGLAGRAELAAFFLEDLLVPPAVDASRA